MTATILLYTLQVTSHILTIVMIFLKERTLAGVAQWFEHWPVNQRVAGSIPSQGTYLGCSSGPQQGAHERQPHIDVSLPLFFPPFPSLK